MALQVLLNLWAPSDQVDAIEKHASANIIPIGKYGFDGSSAQAQYPQRFAGT